MTLLAINPTESAWDRWEVLQLDERSWRICDARLDATDASRLIAYAEEMTSGEIDVLWLNQPAPAKTVFPSLDAAHACWVGFSKS